MTHDQTVARIAELLDQSKTEPINLEALDKAVMSLRDEDIAKMPGLSLTTQFILQRRRKINQTAVNNSSLKGGALSRASRDAQRFPASSGLR